MRVLLDTNVILDTHLQRVPWHAESDAIFRASAGRKIECNPTSRSFVVVAENSGKLR